VTVVVGDLLHPGAAVGGDLGDVHARFISISLM